jgi:integrase/recombinase XerC
MSPRFSKTAEQGMGLADAFHRYLSTERRLASLTCDHYLRDVQALYALTGKTRLQELSVHHIRRFIAQLHGRGLGGKSLARMLSSWRGFFRYLARDHGFSHNPCVGVRAPRSGKTLPHALSPDEASRLMEVDGQTPLTKRDKAVVELFYSSGLRLGELVGLSREDIDFAQCQVTVTGKGSRTRIVPVGRYAVAAIKDWLPERERLLQKGERALFVNHRGRRISSRAIQYLMKKWAIKLGLSSDVHPHVLRHSFATHVLQSSGDLRAVQEMLGHANISTTQIYTHLDFQHLAKVYDAAHPRARKKT